MVLDLKTHLQYKLWANLEAYIPNLIRIFDEVLRFVQHSRKSCQFYQT